VKGVSCDIHVISDVSRNDLVAAPTKTRFNVALCVSSFQITGAASYVLILKSREPWVRPHAAVSAFRKTSFKCQSRRARGITPCHHK
jgi:hypothetical protein